MNASRRPLAARWDRFWHQNEVLRVRLTTFRVVFFGLLAFDLWLLMLPHAPRYGVNGFNVAHLPLLDALLPVPTPALVSLLYLVGGFLALRVALGLATIRSLQALTFIYGGVYFWSQADSYQHHYLISLVLLLCWFLPHDALHGVDQAETGASAPKPSHVRSWAARLIYVEVSVVYFYTALTKTTKYWVNGWALDQIVQTDSMRGFLGFCTDHLGVEPMLAYAFSSTAIMLWQYFVAFAFLVPRLRPLACLTGPVFHGLVEVIDLQIGWFSWYMIGIYYILLFPDRWFLAIGGPVGRLLAPLGRLFERRRPRPLDATPVALVAVAAGLVAAALLVGLVPVAAIGATAAVVGTLVALGVRGRPASRPWLRAGLQVAGVAALVAGLRSSDALYDYHRFWGGDLARRGDLRAAAEHYELANRVRGDAPARHFQLAEIYERLGRVDDARRAWLEGLARDPGSERGRRGLARVGLAETAEGVRR